MLLSILCDVGYIRGLFLFAEVPVLIETSGGN